MGIISWHTDVKEHLSRFGFSLNFEISGQFTLLLLDKRIAINLLSLDLEYNAFVLISLQETYGLDDVYLIHLWEDIWKSKRNQVTGRIKSILGINKRIHGRKTRVVNITQKEADEFLIQHHLLGTARSKHRFGLIAGDELTAVSCFSKLRYMKKEGPEYRSAELVRFATKTDFTVIGGFSKLLKHFVTLYKPEDVMSYADRDWSLGRSYEKADFKLKEITPPSEIWLDVNTLNRYFAHRLPEDTSELKAHQYLRIFNTGNLKYILYLQSSGTSS